MKAEAWFRRRWASARSRVLHRLDPGGDHPGDAVDEILGQRLLKMDAGLGLFRLVHLLDALHAAGIPRTVLSAGSGEGLHESYLAYHWPEMSVVGVDLRPPTVDFSLRNLRLAQADLLGPDVASTVGRADFVYSIECLEHIDDDRAAFAAVAALVAPGGHLYLEVPFASEAEQADPVLCKSELESFDHRRPGYSGRQLEALAASAGLEPLRVAGAFWFPTQSLVGIAHERFGVEAISPWWRTFLGIAQLDVRDGVPRNRGEAVGIKMLARRPR